MKDVSGGMTARQSAQAAILMLLCVVGVMALTRVFARPVVIAVGGGFGVLAGVLRWRWQPDLFAALLVGGSVGLVVGAFASTLISIASGIAIGGLLYLAGRYRRPG